MRYLTSHFVPCLALSFFTAPCRVLYCPLAYSFVSLLLVHQLPYTHSHLSLRCTALRCTALHCTILFNTVLYYTILTTTPYSTLLCTAPYCTSTPLRTTHSLLPLLTTLLPLLYRTVGVAAPFTSRTPSVRAVVDLIRQGENTAL